MAPLYKTKEEKIINTIINDKVPNDLEKYVYQPILLYFLPFVFGFFSRILDKMTDFVSLVLRRNVLKPKKKKRPVAVGTGTSYAIGSLLDSIVSLLTFVFFSTFLKKLSENIKKPPN